MTFREALETGLPVRRAGKNTWRSKFSSPDGPGVTYCTRPHEYFSQRFFLDVLALDLDDYLADDWEVQYPKVEITADQFWDTYIEVLKGFEREFPQHIRDLDGFTFYEQRQLMKSLADKLGLSK